MHGVIREVAPELRLVLLIDDLECSFLLLLSQKIPISVKRLDARLLEDHPSSVLRVKCLVDLPRLDELLCHLALHGAHLLFHPLAHFLCFLGGLQNVLDGLKLGFLFFSILITEGG